MLSSRAARAAAGRAACLAKTPQPQLALRLGPRIQKYTTRASRRVSIRRRARSGLSWQRASDARTLTSDHPASASDVHEASASDVCDAIESIIDYKFNDRALLLSALDYVIPVEELPPSPQGFHVHDRCGKLAWIGDAALNLAMKSIFVGRRYRNGYLQQMFSYLASNARLAIALHQSGLYDAIARYSKSPRPLKWNEAEEGTVFEAIIGAVHQDAKSHTAVQGVMRAVGLFSDASVTISVDQTNEAAKQGLLSLGLDSCPSKITVSCLVPSLPFEHDWNMKRSSVLFDRVAKLGTFTRRDMLAAAPGQHQTGENPDKTLTPTQVPTKEDFPVKDVATAPEISENGKTLNEEGQGPSQETGPLMPQLDECFEEWFDQRRNRLKSSIRELLGDYPFDASSANRETQGLLEKASRRRYTLTFLRQLFLHARREKAKAKQISSEISPEKMTQEEQPAKHGDAKQSAKQPSKNDGGKMERRSFTWRTVDIAEKGDNPVPLQDESPPAERATENISKETLGAEDVSCGDVSSDTGIHAVELPKDFGSNGNVFGAIPLDTETSLAKDPAIAGNDNDAKIPDVMDSINSPEESSEVDNSQTPSSQDASSDLYPEEARMTTGTNESDHDAPPYLYSPGGISLSDDGMVPDLQAPPGPSKNSGSEAASTGVSEEPQPVETPGGDGNLPEQQVPPELAQNPESEVVSSVSEEQQSAETTSSGHASSQNSQHPPRDADGSERKPVNESAQSDDVSTADKPQTAYWGFSIARGWRKLIGSHKNKE